MRRILILLQKTEKRLIFHFISDVLLQKAEPPPSKTQPNIMYAGGLMVSHPWLVLLF